MLERLKLPAFAGLLLCVSVATIMAGETESWKVLCDFRKDFDFGRWQVVNDGVMGGKSQSRFFPTNGMGVFSGVVSLENYGGFASVRSLPHDQDCAGAVAIAVRARGDGQRYKFTARTDADFDSVLYQVEFTPKPGQWAEYRFPIADFVPTFRGRMLSDVKPLDPARLVSVGFLISDKQAGAFRLEVEWIKAQIAK